MSDTWSTEQILQQSSRRQSVEQDGVRVPAGALPAHLRHGRPRRPGSPAEGLLSRPADARAGGASHLQESERLAAAGHRRIGDRQPDRVPLSELCLSLDTVPERSCRRGLERPCTRFWRDVVVLLCFRPHRSRAALSRPVPMHRRERETHNEVTVCESLPLCCNTHPAGSICAVRVPGTLAGRSAARFTSSGSLPGLCRGGHRAEHRAAQFRDQGTRGEIPCTDCGREGRFR